MNKNVFAKSFLQFFGPFGRTPGTWCTVSKPTGATTSVIRYYQAVLDSGLRRSDEFLYFLRDHQKRKHDLGRIFNQKCFEQEWVRGLERCGDVEKQGAVLVFGTSHDDTSVVKELYHRFKNLLVLFEYNQLKFNTFSLEACGGNP